MLNERLKSLRLAKGLTLQQVGDAFGISAASVASWEKGKNQPDSRKLSKIAQVLGTTVEFLLNGSGSCQSQNIENFEHAVPFFQWDQIASTFNKTRNLNHEVDMVMPIHTRPNVSSFATRFPGSIDIGWSQGPVPAGALIFVDPSRELQIDSLVLICFDNNKLELARVQLPAKPSGYYFKSLNSDSSVHNSKDLKVIGTVIEWRLSGKL